MKDSQTLVNVFRGNTIESIHRGHLAIVDGEGNPVADLGNPDFITFFRSAAKPFQAIPFIQSGAAARFGYSEDQIALACSSHSGEVVHTETAAEMLSAAGFSESDLRCGVQIPFHTETANELIRTNKPPTALHNNCSGKHAAMLAFAKHIGAPTDNYEAIENPIQQIILKTISDFCSVSAAEILIAVDGCAAANFALPLNAMALSFARLVNPPTSFGNEIGEICGRIVDAYIRFPELIGGSERLDTLIIREANGVAISKVGAEGLWLCGVKPTKRWPAGLGIALKIEDGEDNRARPSAAVEILRRLGVISSNSLPQLSPMPILNRRGDVVGRVETAFSLLLN